MPRHVSISPVVNCHSATLTRVWHDAFRCVFYMYTRHIYKYMYFTQCPDSLCRSVSVVRPLLYAPAALRSRVCDMSHSCVTYICVCDRDKYMYSIQRRVSPDRGAAGFPYCQQPHSAIPTCLWHDVRTCATRACDSFICVMRLLHMCDVTHSRRISSALTFMCAM